MVRQFARGIAPARVHLRVLLGCLLLQTGNAAAQAATRAGVVLVSVGDEPGVVAAFGGIDNADFVMLAGKPGIRHVIDSLDAVQSLAEKILVCSAATARRSEAAGWKIVVAAKPDPVDRMMRGIEAMRRSEAAMVVPSDLVLVRPESFEAVLTEGLRLQDTDLFYPAIPKEACDRYPEERRKLVRMKNGRFTLAHVQVVRLSFVREHRAKADGIFAARRSFVGMMKLLGVGNVAKFVFGAPSFLDLERSAERKYSCSCRVLITDDADLTTDLSEPSDLVWMEEVMRRRSGQQAGSGRPAR